MPNPGALPKYLAIAEMLTRDIRAGRICDGSRLKGEREMALELDISVGTLRKALAEIEIRGFLRRVQGSGNYVQKPQNDVSLYAFFRLERPGLSGLPTARILDVSFEKAPSDFNTDNAWRIRRVRALDDVEIALEEIFVKLPKSAELNENQLSESLYLTYRARHNLWITHVEDSIGVLKWPHWMSLGNSDTAGHVVRKAWAQDGTLAEISTTWFDPNEARYLSRLA